MSVKKQYLKTRSACKVTFSMTSDDVKDVKQVCIAGEFNGWDAGATPMKKLKNGTFKTTLELKPGREFQFRYVMDGKIWGNEPEADKYLPSGIFGEENSVVII